MSSVLWLRIKLMGKLKIFLPGVALFPSPKRFMCRIPHVSQDLPYLVVHLLSLGFVCSVFFSSTVNIDVSVFLLLRMFRLRCLLKVIRPNDTPSVIPNITGFPPASSWQLSLPTSNNCLTSNCILHVLLRYSYWEYHSKLRESNAPVVFCVTEMA